MTKMYPRLLSCLLVMLLFSGRPMAQNANDKTYKPLLVKNAYRLGISRTDANDAVITNAYTDGASGITYVYLQQTYQQVPVYNAIITTAFRNNELLYNSGVFVKDIATKAGSSNPVITFTDAVKSAARHLSLSEIATITPVADHFASDKKYTVSAPALSQRDIDVTLYWTPVSDNWQQVVLTWNVSVDVKGSADWWNVRVNAQTGEFVQKNNFTVYEHVPNNTNQPSALQLPATKEKGTKKNTAIPPVFLQAPPPNVTSAEYRVIPFPVESPSHGNFATVTNPWLLAGATNNATSLGWHYDGTNNYDITRGNNVFAYLDRTNNDTPDPVTNWPDTSKTAAPSLSFVNVFSATQEPTIVINQKAALDNLFYWNNLMHDVTYQYGFTEAAGNFQNDNQGRGGAGGDFVHAQAQDGGGINNANFSTPADGTSGRMQMYLWSGITTMTVTSPSAIAATYSANENTFTSNNKLSTTGPITGEVVYYTGLNNSHLACDVGANSTPSISGKIALISRGTCDFSTKVKKAQTEGAIAVIVANNTTGNITMSGTDNTITIPAVSITLANGNTIINQLNNNVTVTVTLATSVRIDGDLDNGIVCHEYGHGISNRLTGGASGGGCLGNAEQAGEGWSDYFALMMTTNWATATTADGTNPRSIGTYAAGQPLNSVGIRRYPYSTSLTTNPLTYASMAGNTEVHATGEIWCATIWDLTWALIQAQGITPNLYNNAGTGGNVVAMNLVMTGLKLQSCSPGFLDSRDAILAADSVLYGYAHRCLIWSTFARRGMGFSARQGSSNSASDQVAAYDMPANIIVPRPTVSIATTGSQTTITHTATCNCQAVSGYVIRDTIPAGFTYVSSTPAGTLNGNVLTFPSASFAALETKTFSLVLQAPTTGCTIDSSINDNRDTRTIGGLTASGTPGWNTTTAKAYSPATAWYANDPNNSASSFLTSSATAATTAQKLSILSFWHAYSVEGTYDGGVLEYSIDGGTTWNDASAIFILNAPSIVMDASSTLAGRKAFSGGNNTFRQSLVDVSAFAQTPVAFRFRLEADTALGSDGWYVDDIVRANGCGGILKTGLYNSAGTRLDTLVQPIFVTSPIILPVTLLQFYANPLGSEVVLNWKTAAEVNVKDYTVEWSTNGTTWTTIGNTASLNRATNQYSLVHNTPANGNNYYRIRTNDVDGKYSYSPVRMVNMDKKTKPALVLIPNPVTTDAVLYLSKEAKARSVKIYDAAGSLVRQQTAGANIQQITIATNGLAAGVYTVECVGESRHTIRMVVQH